MKNFGWAAVWLALAAAGCAPAGPTYYDVAGTVTFDGEPIPEGSIVFLPADDPALPPVGGNIVEGKYAIKAYSGSFHVKIFASRENPEKTIETPGGEDIVIRDQYLPERYNEKTELTADVAPVNPNAIDFELTE